VVDEEVVFETFSQKISELKYYDILYKKWFRSLDDLLKYFFNDTVLENKDIFDCKADPLLVLWFICIIIEGKFTTTFWYMQRKITVIHE
jgi:hypothetical protein